MAKIGRPTKYSEELATEICTRIIEGESLLKISKDKEMPSRETIHQWILDPKKREFSDNYARAVNTRTENMFDEIEDIAANDKGDVQRDRLRVDTRKWYLSKVVPKKYGDKLDMTSGGEKMAITGIVIKQPEHEDTES